MAVAKSASPAHVQAIKISACVFRSFSADKKPGQQSIQSEALPSPVGAEKEPPLVVNNDEELQPQWRALENRVNKRVSRPRVEGSPSGRGPRRGSAWDHETV